MRHKAGEGGRRGQWRRGIAAAVAPAHMAAVAVAMAVVALRRGGHRLPTSASTACIAKLNSANGKTIFEQHERSLRRLLLRCGDRNSVATVANGCVIWGGHTTTCGQWRLWRGGAVECCEGGGGGSAAAPQRRGHIGHEDATTVGRCPRRPAGPPQRRGGGRNGRLDSELGLAPLLAVGALLSGAAPHRSRGLMRKRRGEGQSGGGGGGPAGGRGKNGRNRLRRRLAHIDEAEAAAAASVGALSRDLCQCADRQRQVDAMPFGGHIDERAALAVVVACLGVLWLEQLLPMLLAKRCGAVSVAIKGCGVAN